MSQKRPVKTRYGVIDDKFSLAVDEPATPEPIPTSIHADRGVRIKKARRIVVGLWSVSLLVVLAVSGALLFNEMSDVQTVRPETRSTDNPGPEVIVTSGLVSIGPLSENSKADLRLARQVVDPSAKRNVVNPK